METITLKSIQECMQTLNISREEAIRRFAINLQEGSDKPLNFIIRDIENQLLRELTNKHYRG